MEKIKSVRVFLSIIGILGVFSAERYFSSDSFYYSLLTASLLIFLSSIGLTTLLAAKSRSEGHTQEAKCWQILLVWPALMLVSLASFYAYKWTLGGAPAPETFGAKVLLWLFLSSTVLAFFVGIGLELTHRMSGQGETAEPKRLLDSGLRWSGIALLFAGLFALNYGSNRQDKIFDLSYFKATKPGESTLKIAAAVKDPVKIGVFFSKESEVLPYVRDYLSTVAKSSERLELAFYDKDFQPLQAEEFRVSRNGQIVLSKDGRRQRIDVGDKLENARGKLKTLDKDFQKNLLSLTAEAKNVYFLANHGEMTWSLDKNSPPRSLRTVEAILRSQNMNPRSLGTAFASIPEDASIVALASPIASVMPEEIAALKAYLEKGGKLLLMLDIEFGGERPEGLEVGDQTPLLDFLREFGIEYRKEPLISDQDYINQGRGSQLDKLLLYTNVFGSHESVSTLTRNEERLSVFSFYSGAFHLHPAANGWKTQSTILSMKSSYLDMNKNLRFDESTEKKESLPLGVAAEKELGEGKKAKLLVFADSTMFSDPLMGNGGNQLALLESLRWLGDRADISGAIETEEDVKIQHSKGRELFVFMGSIYTIPLLILLLGFFVNRRKRVRA